MWISNQDFKTGQWCVFNSATVPKWMNCNTPFLEYTHAHRHENVNWCNKFVIWIRFLIFISAAARHLTRHLSWRSEIRTPAPLLLLKEQHYGTEPTCTLNTSKSKPPPSALKDLPSSFLPFFPYFFTELSKTAAELDSQWSTYIFIVVYAKAQLWHWH